MCVKLELENTGKTADDISYTRTLQIRVTYYFYFKYDVIFIYMICKKNTHI